MFVMQKKTTRVALQHSIKAIRFWHRLRIKAVVFWGGIVLNIKVRNAGSSIYRFPNLIYCIFLLLAFFFSNAVAELDFSIVKQEKTNFRNLIKN